MNIERNTQLIKFKLVDVREGKDIKPVQTTQLTRFEAGEKNYAYALNGSSLRYIEVAK